MVARPERFELPTTWFEARDSIQLSYGRSVRYFVRRFRPCDAAGTLMDEGSYSLFARTDTGSGTRPNLGVIREARLRPHQLKLLLERAATGQAIQFGDQRL